MNTAQTPFTILPTTLSARLREETRAAHRGAERGRLVRGLLRGDVSREVYASYLAALYRLYEALEAGLERHREHPCVGPLRWPALWRAPALARDLGALLGADWREHVARDVAAGGYVARLVAVTEDAPPLLVAHAYTRYLGDLSGGQILRGAVARFAPDAVALYEFPGLEVREAAQGFRARLDALPLGPGLAAAIVEEAKLAFALHADILDVH